MPRITASLLPITLLAALLTACNKAPAPPVAANPPSAPTAPAAPAAAAAVTYQCHSAQKSRDLFMRFEANGTYDLGDTAADMKPTGDVIFFDKSGMATWGKKKGSWTETNTFDKNKAEYDWSNDPGPEGMTDSARYSCKAL